MKKKILSVTMCLLVFVLFTSLNGPKTNCKNCVEIPPAVAPAAIALQNINHLIDTATANAWIARYMIYKDSICSNTIGADSDILANSESFNKQLLLMFLCKPNCIGINIAYGMDTAYKVHQIIYGVNVNYKKIYIIDTTGVTIGVFAGETGQICPKYCPKPR
jgi:hypothetical protein